MRIFAWCYRKYLFQRSLRWRGLHENFISFMVIAIAVLLNVSFLSAQGIDRITEKAVYEPGMSRIEEIRNTCDKDFKDFYSCYVESIRKAGAPDEAIAFIKMLGEPGFMRDFKKAGPVDIVFVDFPFRANENQGCFLINGNPRLINVDDLSAIIPQMLMKNAVYVKIKEKYPDLNLWMGDRNGTDFIKTISLKNAGLSRK